MAGSERDNDEDIQVTIHGAYGNGPMPVEFRDALIEMVRLVRQGIDDGTIGRREKQEGRAALAARGGA